jgi:hypothetical protein
VPTRAHRKLQALARETALPLERYCADVLVLHALGAQLLLTPRPASH